LLREKEQNSEGNISDNITGDGQGFNKAQEDRQGIALVAA